MYVVFSTTHLGNPPDYEEYSQSTVPHNQYGVEDNLNTVEQGYSIILRKGPVTNVKIFRVTVTPIKLCKCDMSWIFLTKNVI